MAITIRPPRTETHSGLMMAAAALVLSGAVAFGTVTVLDNGGGGTQTPAATVDANTASVTAVSDTSDLARYAEENGLVGASPTSLRPTNGGEAAITQGEYSIVRSLEANEVVATTGADPIVGIEQGSGLSGLAFTDVTDGRTSVVTSQPGTELVNGRPVNESTATTTVNDQPAGPR